MIYVLRLIHVFAGVFWAGAVFFVASFLLPSVEAAGPGAGPVMRQLVGVRKYPMKVFIVALVTVLSGLWLFYHNNSVSAGAFARSHSGMTYSIGAIAALLTLPIGALVLSPAATKLNEIGAAVQASGGKPTPEQAAELGRAQGRMKFGTRLAASLLGVTVLTMALGRYM
jgi:uncharacterized membrane protein